jgi:hypothetical protein
MRSMLKANPINSSMIEIYSVSGATISIMKGR